MKNNALFFCSVWYIGICFLLGCNYSGNKKIAGSSFKKASQHVDIPLDSLPERSLPEMELNNFRSINDTIVFTSPVSFLYFPFGKFKKETDVLGDYPGWKLSDQQYVIDTEPVDLYKYRYKQSFVKMIKNDESGLLDIVSARITDHGIALRNGITIGVLKADFVKLFFKPGVNLEKYKVFKIESLILGITHIYSFNGDRLNEIIIDSDYQVDKK